MEREVKLVISFTVFFLGGSVRSGFGQVISVTLSRI